LYLGVAGVLLTWAGVLVVECRAPAGPGPVGVCLAGMVLLGLWQLVPLPGAALAAVSPATAELRTDLAPADREWVVGDDPAPASDGGPISLDPAATRGQVVQLVAILVLFVVVRDLATPAGLRRLAVAAVGNAVLLSGFALAQHFTAPPQTVYWEFPTLGQPFGPFVCRNHFPFYANVCLGLGLGLLLGGPVVRGGVGSVLGGLARHTPSLWLVAGLGLVVAANVTSLSRGGMLALGVTAVGFALVGAVGSGRAGRAAALAAVAAVGVGLVGWLGADEASSRLDTVWGGDLQAEGRTAVWARVLPLAGRFPVWGTGYGTFEAVEPMQRSPGDFLNVSWDHAHNEYLEVLVEGGAGQLALLLLAAGFVYRAGARAIRQFAGRPASGWVAGALFGLTTVAAHSFLDFGLHIPAIALLVAVVAGFVAGIGDRPPPPRGGIAAAGLSAVVCVMVAVMLPLEGWQKAQAEQYRLAAVRAGQRLPVGHRDVVVRYLQEAVEVDPDDARLRLALADARYEEYQARQLHRAVRWPLAGLAGGAAAATPGPDDLDEAYLRPALRDYLRAREAQPLAPSPHARLAAHRGELVRPDRVTVYLDRACRVEPADGRLWYLAGLAHLAEGDRDRAWEQWRRALACSPDQLPSVVAGAIPHADPTTVAERVLPQDPNVLAAAARTPAVSDRPDVQRAARTRALDVLGEGPGLGADGWNLRARLLHDLGRSDEAVAALRAAVEADPDRADWGCELAAWLVDRGDLGEARDRLRSVLQRDPSHARARELHQAVVRRLLREEAGE
jgi:tetratricopeptide (TPR) repeat protein/O-antigen ligase